MHSGIRYFKYVTPLELYHMWQYKEFNRTYTCNVCFILFIYKLWWVKGSLFFFTKLCEKSSNQHSDTGLFVYFVKYVSPFVVLFIRLRSAIYSFIYQLLWISIELNLRLCTSSETVWSLTLRDGIKLLSLVWSFHPSMYVAYLCITTTSVRHYEVLEYWQPF